MWDVLQAILVGWPCCGMNQLATTKTFVGLVGDCIAQTTPKKNKEDAVMKLKGINMFFWLVGVAEMSDLNIFLIKGLEIFDIDPDLCPSMSNMLPPTNRK